VNCSQTLKPLPPLHPQKLQVRAQTPGAPLPVPPREQRLLLPFPPSARPAAHPPAPKTGGKERGPSGGASSSCKGQGGGSRRLFFFSQKFPFPTISSLPWGLGGGKRGLTVPPVSRAPEQKERGREEGVVLDKLQVRGERGLGPTWKPPRGRGEAFPHTGDSGTSVSSLGGAVFALQSEASCHGPHSLRPQNQLLPRSPVFSCVG